MAAETVLKHLNKPASPELGQLATTAIVRLAATVERINERSIGDDAGTTEAWALCDVLQGRWARAAADVEPVLGTAPLLKAFVSALRLETFGADLALRL